MISPKIRDFVWLEAIPQTTAVLLASASVRARAAARLPIAMVRSFEDIPRSATALIVVGGGSLMDQAKYLRARRRPDLSLVLIPSIWGSGAEVSQVAVLNSETGKEIHVGEEFLADAVVYWPEITSTVSPMKAREACGDAWAHALEAFMSPLASNPLRREVVELVREMLKLPLGPDGGWFEASAHACRLQASASAGLVHGIAHVLEARLNTRYPNQGWGHAKLCSLFLLPVMKLNRAVSSKWSELIDRHALDEDAILGVLEQLFDREAFLTALPVVEENWAEVLRDRCTRTNGTLIRPSHLQEMKRQVAA